MSGRAPSSGFDRGAPVPLATGRLGVALLLASLSMLFAASIAGYLVVRARAEVWPPPGVPGLPLGLWLSTAILVASSGTMHAAVVAARRGLTPRLRWALAATFGLGVAFLISQTVNWFSLVAVNVQPRANLFAFSYWVLTVLHALHVVGGLVPLAVVTVRSWRGAYGPQRHSGVVLSAMYWHFLDVVWLVLFTLLLLTT